MTLSTTVFLDLEENASHHGIIIFDRKEEGECGSSSDGSEVTEEEANIGNYAS